MSKSIDHIQGLLRGELSAIETYDQALEQVDPSDGAIHLRRIRDEHRKAVDVLSDHARAEGETPAESSGVWGAFAKAVEGVSKLMGDSAALSALREGEEHGLSEYEGALRSGHLPPLLAQLVRSEMLPRQREHIATLRSLAASA